jgi:hypothetical protein
LDISIRLHSPPGIKGGDSPPRSIALAPSQ